MPLLIAVDDNNASFLLKYLHLDQKCPDFLVKIQECPRCSLHLASIINITRILLLLMFLRPDLSHCPIRTHPAPQQTPRLMLWDAPPRRSTCPWCSQQHLMLQKVLSGLQSPGDLIQGLCFGIVFVEQDSTCPRNALSFHHQSWIQRMNSV